MSQTLTDPTDQAVELLQKLLAALNEDRSRWIELARCRQPNDPVISALAFDNPVDVFYSDDYTVCQLAVNLCLRCPVRQECLAFALTTECLLTERVFGVFGGLPPYDRNELLKDRSETVQGILDIVKNTPLSQSVTDSLNKYGDNSAQITSVSLPEIRRRTRHTMRS